MLRGRECGERCDAMERSASQHGSHVCAYRACWNLKASHRAGLAGSNGCRTKRRRASKTPRGRAARPRLARPALPSVSCAPPPPSRAERLLARSPPAASPLPRRLRPALRPAREDVAVRAPACGYSLAFQLASWAACLATGSGLPPASAYRRAAITQCQWRCLLPLAAKTF